ncbi:hypothetical protein NCS52_01434300 [Fusarium sp. LHS14.1]|nr:hypothetical protein NCS52_01434300 [Fusarium sp. LHS14.1]
MSSGTSSSELDDRASSSVLELTQQCISLFEGCATSNRNGRSSAMETRLADLRLWAAGIGAISEGTESLDFTFQSEPDDLFLVKTILIMLADFVADYSALLAEDQPISDAVERIDSTLENLIIVSASVRHDGTTLRRYRAAPRFGTRDYEELRRHLECVILLRPSKSGLPTELNPSNLSVVQKRLIEANLQRRHRFVVAQKCSGELKESQSYGSKDQDFLEEKPLINSEGAASQQLGPSVARSKGILETTPKIQDPIFVPPKESPVLEKHVPEQANADRTRQSNVSSKRKGIGGEFESNEHLRATPKHSDHQRIISTGAYTNGALAVDDSLEARDKRVYGSGIVKARIIPLDTAAEFPRPPPNLKGRRFGKCPCCCQEIPVEAMLDPIKWRKHIEEDLLPYTCIVEDCPMPHTTLFATRQEWKAHVQADHSSQWHCPLCDEADIVMESEEAIVHHFKTQHQNDVKRLTLETLLSWSKRKFKGITSCPLCYSYDREDSPELINHVLGHVYEFSLRALPWPKPVKHNLSKTVGAFTPHKDKKAIEAVLKWLGVVEDESVTVPQLPALEASPEVDFSEVADETGYVPDDEYFDTKWIDGFSEQASISFDSSSSIISGSPLHVIPTISDTRGVADREDDGNPGTQEPEDPSPPDPARSVAARVPGNYSRQHLSRTQPRMPPSDNSQHTSLLVGPAISTSSGLAKGRGKADRRQDKKLESGRIWLLERMPLKYLIMGISSHFQIQPIQGSLGQDLDGLWGDDTIRRARAELSAAVRSLSGFKTRGFVESQVVKDWLQGIETSGYRWLSGLPAEQEIPEAVSVILNDSKVGSLSTSREGGRTEGWRQS